MGQSRLEPEMLSTRGQTSALPRSTMFEVRASLAKSCVINSVSVRFSLASAPQLLEKLHYIDPVHNVAPLPVRGLR